MSSLQGKIVSAYAFSKLVMLGFALVVFADLFYLYHQIEAGQSVTDFREATLEMRRDEKNLFLYRDLSSLDQLLLQSEDARRHLQRSEKAFVAIAGEADYFRVREVFERYVAALNGYPRLGPAEQARARETIRTLGHALSEASDEISRKERQVLADVVRTTGIILMIAFVVVVLLGVAGGWFLGRRVVRPLRSLQEGVIAIEAGHARELPLPSRDREIESFVQAFNAMLKHMRQQQDQVKRNEKAAALGVLVSGVAHELNNPLSNISTSVQLLLESGESEDRQLQRLWLDQIDSETERARRIVRRLLDCVRQPRLHLQRVPLNDLLQAALSMIHRQLPEDVSLCIGATADVLIEVDRDRMSQVFINLIRNAADAGARHIHVDAQVMRWDESLAESGPLEGNPACMRESGRGLRIDVRDDGPGIAAEIREQVFDPFFTTRTAGEGTGLGLFLVEEIVSEHRGCILLKSPPEGGTQFSIWLPLESEA